MTQQINQGTVGVEQWHSLAQQLRVDSIRSSSGAGSGHPTSSMSAADLMAVGPAHDHGVAARERALDLDDADGKQAVAPA